MGSEDDERLLRGCLIVDYLGEIRVLEPNEGLSFGRDADLTIDDNEFLHRKLGRFEHRAGRWWVANIGSKIEFEVVDRTTRAAARMTPGTTQTLPGSDMVLHFVAGPTRYELLLRCPAEGMVETTEPSDTLNLSSLPWTEEQRLLMTILAESLLREPHAPLALPTNRDARLRLGWSEAKFNRKLDNVCDRLSGAGVRGLQKGVDQRNNQRRRILAETVVSRAILTAEDLGCLERHEAAATSS